MAIRDKYHSLMPKSSAERFKYTYLALACACLVIILCISIFVINRLSYNNLIKYVEIHSEKIVDAICYTEVDAIHINDTLTIPATSYDYLDTKIRDTYDSLDILKVIIFDNKSNVLYSNDKKIIGTRSSDESLPKVLTSGKLASTYRHHQTITDLQAEKRLNIDIINVFVPILGNSNQVIGAFTIAFNATQLNSHYSSQLFSSVAILVLSICLISLISFIIIIRETKELKHAYDLLESFATTDALTGLYNRTYYELELERLIVSRKFPVSIVSIDLDGLKQTNDTFGHAAGDKMICKAAEILKSAFRADDMIARIGGDEFIIFLPETNHNALLAAVERLIKCRDVAAQLPDGFAVQFSMGTATAESREKLIGAVKIADAEMYKNKIEHHNPIS